MDKWQEVIDLENLTQLNLKIAQDALDDAIQYLQECRENLEKALLLIRMYYGRN